MCLYVEIANYLYFTCYVDVDVDPVKTSLHCFGVEENSNDNSYIQVVKNDSFRLFGTE